MKQSTGDFTSFSRMRPASFRSTSFQRAFADNLHVKPHREQQQGLSTQGKAQRAIPQ